MKTMGISEFKAKCIAVLKRAHRTRTPLVVTHRGKRLVRIDPLPASPPARRLGAFEGKAKILGDVVRFEFGDEWEMGR